MDVPRTLIVGYDESVIELLSRFMDSVPVLPDVFFKYKPKPQEMLNVTIMSPFPRVPFPHILDVLDRFNVGEIAKRFSVVIVTTEEPYTLSAAMVLKSMGLEVYLFDGEESVELDAEILPGERVMRRIKDFYVIPGYAKEIFEEPYKEVDGGYITNTGCIIAESPEAAKRILFEQSLRF